ncbi:MAG: glycosyltransferase family 4 protein [Deltaproteobacteria bacterium]|nr:glycosyltransferase family 4 protein [Deltaproteobacteria bacterium]
MAKQGETPIATLVLARDFPPDIGGVQTVVSELAARTPNTRVIARRTPGDEAFDRDFPAVLTRIAASEHGPRALRPILRQIALFLAVFRAWRTKRFGRIVCGYLAFAGPVAWIWRGLFGVPYTVLTYGTEIVRARDSMWSFAWRRILRDADFVATIAEPLVEILGAMEPGARVVKIPLGCTVSAYDPPPLPNPWRGVDHANRRVVLSVGRLVARKGFDTVIRALGDAGGRRGDTIYLVAGDGPDRARLESLAGECGVADRIVFAGRVEPEELRALYARCDVFVMPSRREGDDIEGFGLVFVEAGAFGKPVIGGDSGGVSEAVRDGVNGLLVDPTDPVALRDALDRMLNDADLAARLGKGGRLLATTEFTFERMSEVFHAAWSHGASLKS